MDKIAAVIAIVSRTPKHFFFGSAADVSGEALLVAETPLIKKVKQYESNFDSSWSELGAFLLRLSGSGETSQDEVTPLWAPLHSVQPATEATTLKTNIEAGIPLVTQLRRQGWTEDELEAMQKDEADQKAKTTSMASALLEQARIKQEQANDGDGNS